MIKKGGRWQGKPPMSMDKSQHDVNTPMVMDKRQHDVQNPMIMDKSA